MSPEKQIGVINHEHTTLEDQKPIVRQAADLEFRPELLKKTRIEVFDTMEQDLKELDECLTRDEMQAFTQENGTSPEKIGRWVYLPWKKEIYHLLPRNEHARLVLSRHEGVTSREQVQELGSAKVLIVGASTGSEVMDCLVREGIGIGLEGSLEIWDGDKVAASNLGRCSVFTNADKGKEKAVVAAQRAWEIFPEANIHPFAQYLRPEEMEKAINNAEYIVDACDNGLTKLWLRVISRELGKDVVMGTNLEGQGAIVDIERFSLNQDLPVFHGRLEKILGRFNRERMMELSKDKEKQQSLLPVIIAAGVGIENVSSSLLRSLEMQMKGEISSFAQMRSVVGVTSGAEAAFLKRCILNKKVPERAIITPLESSASRKEVQEFVKNFFPPNIGEAVLTALS